MLKRCCTIIFCVIICSVLLVACGENKNSKIVGKWIPSTVTMNNKTMKYSSLGTDDDQFGLQFESNGNCTIITTGIVKKGTFVFNDTAIDVMINGESKKLNYATGIITLSLNYENNPMQISFIKAREEN